MGRQADGGLKHGYADLLERVGDLALVEAIDDRLIFVGDDALAEHHRHPARDVEKLRLCEDASLVAKLLDAPGEAVGYAHAGALFPERGIVAVHRLVVEDDEVADPLEQALHPAV